jgi:ligand-binding SRPBCC domain-containing protein
MERISHWSIIPVPVQAVWDFHMDPRNLARVTPHGSWVRVVTPEPRLELNAEITVEIKLMHLVPVKMTNRIIVFDPLKQFVDVQVRGPFYHFRHEHRFREVEGGGCRLTDTVELESRGFLGRMMDSTIAKHEVEHLLKVRHQKTAEMLLHGKRAAK